MADVELVMDCADADALASFWTAALGYDFGHDWIAMADPEGNEFCVCSC